jgi:hypothetical protein
MRKRINRLFGILGLMVCLQVVAPPVVMQAQCPMCRMSAESNLKNGGTEGKGLNSGILYMLATPYLIVGLIGFTWYRNRKKNADQLANAENAEVE